MIWLVKLFCDMFILGSVGSLPFVILACILSDVEIYYNPQIVQIMAKQIIPTGKHMIN